MCQNPLQRRSPVDHRRFIQLLGNALESGEQHHGHEGIELPDLDYDEGEHGDVRVGEEQNGLLDQTHRLQRVVDEPELVVVHPFPDQGGNNVRNHPRNEKECPEQSPRLEVFAIQKQGKRQSYEIGPGDCTHHPQDGSAQGRPKHRFIEQCLGIVVQTHPSRRVGLHELLTLKTDEDPFDERNEVQEGHEDRGG